MQLRRPFCLSPLRFARRSPFDVESLRVVLAVFIAMGWGWGWGWAGLASTSVRTGRQVELEGDANVSVSERICDALCCEC
jgi:cell division septal protein FtsQ